MNICTYTFAEENNLASSNGKHLTNTLSVVQAPAEFENVMKSKIFFSLSKCSVRISKIMTLSNDLRKCGEKHKDELTSQKCVIIEMAHIFHLSAGFHRYSLWLSSTAHQQREQCKITSPRTNQLSLIRTRSQERR